MVTVNLSDTNDVGNATMNNGDFLTFDPLSNNKFALIIPSLPNVQFFMQSVSLPDININPVKINTNVVDYNVVGEKVNYLPFSVEFLVDKYSRNWAETFDWMKKISVNGTEINATDNITLMLNGKDFIRFYDAFPTSLTGNTFDATAQDVVYVKSIVTFSYSYFEYLGQFKTENSSYK